MGPVDEFGSEFPDFLVRYATCETIGNELLVVDPPSSRAAVGWRIAVVESDGYLRKRAGRW
jgi:hypothetical protein